MARWLTVGCLLGLPMIGWSTDYPRVGSEPLLTIPDPAHKAALPVPRVAFDPATAFAIRLPPLAGEAAALVSADIKRFTVGIGREIPAVHHKALGDGGLPWRSLADGRHSAILTVTSAGARALRLAISLHVLPAEARLRFFLPASGEVLQTLDAREALAPNTGQLWSPVVEGDSIGLEISLPAHVDPARVVLEPSAVSHFPEGHPARKDLSDIGNAGACNVDVVCSDATPAAVVESVAKYVLTGLDGFSYLCTGTLLNDTDPASQLPYFLTAAHCVGNPTEAASMELYWFFQRERCGGPPPTSVLTQYGGASLLASDPEENSDHSLLLLNQPPPAGTTLSGWSTEPVIPGTPVLTLHHPAADLKKISLGVVEGAAPFIGPVDGQGDYLLTRWNLGTTEGGSSGAGLFLPVGAADPVLVGVLSGGFAACFVPDEPDWYGRFDRAFPIMQPYLQPDVAISPAFTGLWWDPVRGGQGVQLVAEGNRLGGVWYLYDETGAGQWLTFSGTLTGTDTVSTALLRFSGPPLGTPWDDSAVENRVAGELTLILVDPTEITMRYRVGNVTGELTLSPFRAGAMGALSGVWYNPQQSGRGLQLLAQQDRLEGAWYYYDRNGVGNWVTFQANFDDSVASGELWQFAGPPLGTPYREDLVQYTPVGTVTVEPLAPDQLSLNVRIDGAQESLLLVPFSLP